MAVEAVESIFSIVEATLNSEWLNLRQDSITSILGKIEIIGGTDVSIQFKNGNHVVCGPLNAIIKIFEAFAGEDSCRHAEDDKYLKEHEATTSELQSFSTDESSLFMSVVIGEGNTEQGNRSPKTCFDLDPGDKLSGVSSDASKNFIESTSERDPDIWEYIEVKKLNDLKKLLDSDEASFMSSLNEETGLYEVTIRVDCVPETNVGDEQDRLMAASEKLDVFFQDMFDNCAIEVINGRFNPDDINSQYINARYPDVYLKYESNCMKLSGPVDEVRKAKRHVQQTIRDYKKLEGKKGKASQQFHMHGSMSAQEKSSRSRRSLVEGGSLDDGGAADRAYCTLGTVPDSVDDDSLPSTSSAELEQ